MYKIYLWKIPLKFSELLTLDAFASSQQQRVEPWGVGASGQAPSVVFASVLQVQQTCWLCEVPIQSGIAVCSLAGPGGLKGLTWDCFLLRHKRMAFSHNNFYSWPKFGKVTFFKSLMTKIVFSTWVGIQAKKEDVFKVHH